MNKFNMFTCGFCAAVALVNILLGHGFTAVGLILLSVANWWVAE